MTVVGTNTGIAAVAGVASTRRFAFHGLVTCTDFTALVVLRESVFAE